MMMTADMRTFLTRIMEYTGAATSRECGLASRQEDTARQACRRQKYVLYEGGYWRITDAGRAALAGNAIGRPRSVTIPLTAADEDVEQMARGIAKANRWEYWDDARKVGHRELCRGYARAAYTALVARYSGGQG